jgi:hypothetical protein
VLFLRLETAEALRVGDVHVTTPELYLAWHLHMIRERGLARVWTAGETLAARVNHGRWIADCPACGSGMWTHPDWRLACCGECGAVYTGVEFPGEIDQITTLLLLRPRDRQNWFPHETARDLLAENLVPRPAFDPRAVLKGGR